MSLKYSVLSGVMRAINMQKFMAQPYSELKKRFKTGKKELRIPELSDPEFCFTVSEIAGSPVLFIRHKKNVGRACIYLTGGGMLKYPKTRQAKELIELARLSKRDMILPYYPLSDKHSLTDVYEMLYALYRRVITDYQPEKILILGGSSGGNLALGLVSHINAQNENVEMPGKIYAGSPGTMLLTDEEKAKAKELDKSDLIMSRRATETIQEGMMGGREVPDYMKFLQLGDYSGLKDVYLCFGGDEVFAAAAESIKVRLENFGVHVTCEIGKGLYHCYSLMPFVKEAKPGYEHMLRYISE